MCRSYRGPSARSPGPRSPARRACRSLVVQGLENDLPGAADAVEVVREGRFPQRPSGAVLVRPADGRPAAIDAQLDGIDRQQLAAVKPLGAILLQDLLEERLGVLPGLAEPDLAAARGDERLVVERGDLGRIAEGREIAGEKS